MKKEFLICILQHRSNVNYALLALLHLHTALREKPELSKKIKIVIAATNHNSVVLQKLTRLFSKKYDLDLFCGPSFYPDKIEAIIKKYNPSHYTFFIKHDEDVLVSKNTWLTLLGQTSAVLSDEKNLLLTANLSTGIPSWYYFCNQFLASSLYQKLLRLLPFLKIAPRVWEQDYSAISEFQEKNLKWNEEQYWKIMNDLRTPLKGLHPVRVFLLLPFIINSYVASQYTKFQNTKVNNKIAKVSDRYLCNSFFIMKYSLYNKIFHDKSLYLDSYDELPINNYKHKTSTFFVFLKNSLAVHFLYNSVYDQILMINGKLLSGRNVEEKLLTEFIMKTQKYLQSKKDPCIESVTFYKQPLFEKVIHYVGSRTRGTWIYHYLDYIFLKIVSR